MNRLQTDPGRDHRNFGWIVGVFLLLVVSLPLAAAELPLPGDAKLQTIRGLDLDQAFTTVATGVRFEPYLGILRGPRSTALASGGNSADQALLLADILRARGYEVRFVRGKLEGANLDVLIRAVYPPDLPTFELNDAYLPFDPGRDATLRSLVADHVWLELDQGDGTWLPLDPSFPNARLGEAYATPVERLADLPAEFHQSIKLTFRDETVGGEKRELGTLEGKTRDLGLTPLSLTTIAVPQLEAPEPEQKKGGSAGGFLGSAFTGGREDAAQEAAPETSAKRAGNLYRRLLQHGGESIELASSLVLTSAPESMIRREWLEITLTAPGQEPRTVTRELYVADAPAVDGSPPEPYRRYTLAILPGPIEVETVREYAGQLRAKVDLDALRARIDAIRDSTDGVAASEAVAVDDDIGPMVGHLAALAYAAESDALTRRIAHNNAVAIAQATPRVIITSVEGGHGRSWQVALDLRIDEVEAWPFPGYAARAAHHFQSARGIQESMLEGQFLERVLGIKQTANTAELVGEVNGGQEAMLLLTAGQEDQLHQIENLSPYARRLIEASLARGREVIIPPEPVELAGRPRFGWWERDPATGRIVGVMDDGLHQAMTSYSVNTTEIGLNDDTGFVIGLIVGATGTQFLIAAKILEYGAVTNQLIADVEARIKKLKCLSCPKAEASASAGVSFGDNCFSVEKKAEAGASVSAGSFCAKYVAGMSCASAFILQGLKGSGGGPGLNASAGFEATAGCE